MSDPTAALPVGTTAAKAEPENDRSTFLEQRRRLGQVHLVIQTAAPNVSMGIAIDWASPRLTPEQEIEAALAAIKHRLLDMLKAVPMGTPPVDQPALLATYKAEGRAHHERINATGHKL